MTNIGLNNAGKRNTGNWNTGSSNTGNWNTGSSNTGSSNTGNWNTGNCNTGSFNTITPEGAYFFNKWLTFEEWDQAYKPYWLFMPVPTEWVPKDQMTDAEKKANPSWETAGGYLRKNSMRDEWRKAYEGASDEDIQAVRDLPNFDYGVFEEITGLDIRPSTQETPDQITLDGKKYKLIPIEERAS